MSHDTSHINKKEVKPIKSGIYKILNTKNGKCYIGSAVYIATRIATHRSSLRKNKHQSRHLQASWNKYGGWFFEFIILERCEKDKLVEREQFYIDTLKPEYNKRPKAASNVGIKYGKQTAEHIEKRTAPQRNRKRSAEACLNNSNAQKGKKLLPHVKAILASYLNRPCSEEKKIKIGIANSKPDKWPHSKRSKCLCRECADKRNLMRREFRKHTNAFLETAVMVNIHV